ncbi:TPA: hypothetical protein DD394_04350 [bacterium UBP9_UBA11836]|nr:hypothetical protein [bacterium UBP9_UBA11836]
MEREALGPETAQVGVASGHSKQTEAPMATVAKNMLFVAKYFLYIIFVSLSSPTVGMWYFSLNSLSSRKIAQIEPKIFFICPFSW